MIDLHSHVLPGVDDGSSSVEQTAEMLRLWRSFAFRTRSRRLPIFPAI